MAVQLSRADPEWFQITYTSADSVIGSRGGWGVKETTPETPAQVVETLTHWVTTRLVEVTETSQFASTDVLRERPRRLLSREIDGLSCLWHAATAGPDATGRPGNVFTHAAALKAPEPLLRPIEYWRSPSWLSPFGVIDVNAARLGELVPGTAVSRHSVASFIRADDRLFSLEWLVAAVDHVVGRESMLVLATDSADEAALWLGAISYLTSAPQARRIGWVTFQRAADLEGLAGQGLRIVCIPREDLEIALEGAGPDRLVLDASWTLDDPGDRSEWRHAGQTFPVSPWWQNSVLDAFALDDASLVRVLVLMDELVAGMPVREVPELPLHWALSMSLLADPQAVVSSREELRDECLCRVSRATLATHLVRPIVDEAISQMPEQEKIKLSSHEVWGPILEEQTELEAIESYLSGGWQRGEPAPKSSVDSSLVRRAAEGRLSELLRLATLDAAGTPEQVLAAARAVHTILKHGVEGAASPKVAEAAAILRGRLAEHSFNDDDVWWLHSDLLPERRAQERTGSAGLPETQRASPSIAGRGAETFPPVVMAKPISSTAPSHGQPRDHLTNNSWRTLPADQMAALGQLREEAVHDPARQHAVDDCLLVAAGMRVVPLRGVTEHLAEDRQRAETLLRDEGASPGESRAVIGWLAAYWTLLDILAGPERVPDWFVETIRANTDVVMSAVARFLFELPDVRMARALFVAIFRDIHGGVGPILAVMLPKGERLGLRVCLDAWERMSGERRQAILAIAAPDLDLLERKFPGKVGPRLQAFKEQLDPVPDEPAHHRLRTGRS